MEPLKGLPVWVRQMAEDEAIEQPSRRELGRRYKKSEATIYKYINNQDFKNWVEGRREELFRDIRHKVKTLLHKALEVMETLLEETENDRLRFDIAKELLSGTKTLSTSTDVNLVGDVQINMVKIEEIEDKE